MREKKWTKGPWKRDPISPRQINAPNGRSIGRAHLGVGGDAEPFANARLIAAAPDLVEALDEVLMFRPPNDEVARDVWARAERALAKAYGEGE